MSALVRTLQVSERDAKIIAHYAGIDGKEELSVEEIARKFNLAETDVETIVLNIAFKNNERVMRHLL